MPVPGIILKRVKQKLYKKASPPPNSQSSLCNTFFDLAPTPTRYQPPLFLGAIIFIMFSTLEIYLPVSFARAKLGVFHQISSPFSRAIFFWLKFRPREFSEHWTSFGKQLWSEIKNALSLTGTGWLGICTLVWKSCWVVVANQGKIDNLIELLQTGVIEWVGACVWERGNWWKLIDLSKLKRTVVMGKI